MSTATRVALRRAGFWACVTVVVAGCTSGPVTPPPEPVQPPATPVAPPPAPPVATGTLQSSFASTPREYRRDGAAHLYAKNSNRIFKGKMPPLLHAVAVLQVEINAKGTVTGLHWMRAPSHAPEVVAEIERSVRSASPFPAPVKMGRVTYTDTWLWHKSGHFQLDTLTEGQL
nr:hypothetical protein [Rhodoferax sp.]